jgi:hypothetical protein
MKKFSKSQIDKLGDRLKSGNPTAENSERLSD